MNAAVKLVDRWADQTWRLNNLYFITDELGRKTLFRPNWAQTELLKDLHPLNVILKARQLGFTTLIQLYMLDQCLFCPDTRAGTIAHTREDAEAFFRDKVKFPYDELPEGIKDVNPATQDSARHLSFKNNSSVRVGTSLRSGTFQYLHVSEYGKICAKYPEKAIEIRTGAFNTVHTGQMIFVESTAEGQGGDFYSMCQQAQTLQRRGVRLTPLDFKFHFFPWWRHPAYTLPPDDVILSSEVVEYFQKLNDDHGIVLTPSQKAWYAKKAEQQGSYMTREFPSTPDEAFESAIEGAYFSHEMAQMEIDGRVCDIPIERGLPVETWWDLGMNDLMSIAWVQRVSGFCHILDYYEDSGYGLAHYTKVLQDKQRENDWTYGPHYWPHDGRARILDEKGRARQEVMADLGYSVTIVNRPGDVNDSIERARNLLPRVKMQRRTTDKLVMALKNYRREWDDNTATWKNRPLHNWASHPADMIRTGAETEDRRERKPLVMPKSHASHGVI